MRRMIQASAGVLAMLMMPVTGAVARVLHDQPAAPAGAHRVGMDIVVPAYWYQRTASWLTLAYLRNPPRWHGGTTRTVSEAIFNPCAPGGATCSPGSSVNKAARADMRAAQANHVVFYGYVWTNSGSVPVTTVKEEIREYASWYGLRDIFFDGASTSCTVESSYYHPLYAYVHSRHGKVILNPGTQPPACYLRSADQISVFEGTGAEFAAYTAASWMTSHSPARFIAIVHTTASPAAMAAIVTRAGQLDHIGNIYVTSVALPNPYARLPWYWRQEVTQVSKSYSR